MAYDKDLEIFKGKSFEDLSKRIWTNVDSKNKMIQKVFATIDSFIQDDSTARELLPLLKDYLDASIRNDEHLIKLAAIIQRAMSRSDESGADGLLLSEEDRKALMETYDVMKKDDSESSLPEDSKLKELLDKHRGELEQSDEVENDD